MLLARAEMDFQVAGIISQLQYGGDTTEIDEMRTI